MLVLVYGHLDHLVIRSLQEKKAGVEEKQATPEEGYTQETDMGGTEPIQQNHPHRKVVP